MSANCLGICVFKVLKVCLCAGWVCLCGWTWSCLFFGVVCSTQLCPPAPHHTWTLPPLTWVSFQGPAGSTQLFTFLPFLIQTSIDYFPYVQVRSYVCLSLGAGADKQGDGAGPRKGSTFWKSKFDMKSNQLLQPIPSLTAGVAHSTTKNTKLSSGPFIQNAFCLEFPIVIQKI